MHDSKLGHGEDGKLVPTTDFDWPAVEFTKDEDLDISKFSQEDVDRALVVLTALLKWVWQSGMNNGNGIQIRAIIMCWVFLKELRPLDLTQMAKGFGRDKQSLGRWVDNFKRWFPRIRIPHMRPTK
jgi:hypothetical protein